jgi:hypothetical protein
MPQLSVVDGSKTTVFGVSFQNAACPFEAFCQTLQFLWCFAKRRGFGVSWQNA